MFIIILKVFKTIVYCMRLIEVYAFNRSLFLLFANIIVASYVLGLSAEHECIFYVFFGSGDGLDLIVAQAMHS